MSATTSPLSPQTPRKGTETGFAKFWIFSFAVATFTPDTPQGHGNI
ncbi:hypothetical protein APA_1308 [Pseudanabaena sp. lw0831]|nr:hypothetical protein APA_1308 [Pseudanabaena sp. lw0831]